MEAARAACGSPLAELKKSGRTTIKAPSLFRGGSGCVPTRVTGMPETYLEWNDALAASIFRPDMAGRQVFLFVNHDLVENLGGEGSIPRFVAAVEQGPPWVDNHMGLCQKAFHTFEGWRERGYTLPPYIGYLALFVLALSVEGPFPRHAYHSRLRTLLGMDDVRPRALPSFDRMLELWDDLEVWSNRDMEGSLGVFSIRIAGEWIHVGLPKAQALLREHERRALPAIFAAALLDSKAPPSDAYLVRALRRHGGQSLSSQTLDLLAQPDSEPDLFALLLDVVRHELDEWEGQAPERDDHGAAPVTNALARICLRVDRVAGRATATLRVASNAEFPEDGLLLAQDGEGPQFACVESLPGWSSPLTDLRMEREADASRFSWLTPHKFVDEAGGWCVRLPGAPVRIFVPGLPFDLPGHVEVRRLTRSTAFLLAASERAVPAVTAWGESGEADLNQVPISEGLATGWVLYESSGARSDAAVRDVLPELALPTTVQILLHGGIRTGVGNTFFRFAPPSVVVEGGSGEEVITCNGSRITTAAFPVYQLPSGLPSGERITLKVIAGDHILRRQALFLSDDFDWNLRRPICKVNAFGVVTPVSEADPEESHDDDDVAGALGGGTGGTRLPIRPALPAGRHALIGRRIGEVYSSASTLAASWQPVWVVEVGRRGRAEYCGGDLSNAHPVEEISGTADDVATWKDILWQRRKRTEEPAHPSVRRVWREYVELAGRV